MGWNGAKDDRSAKSEKNCSKFNRSMNISTVYWIMHGNSTSEKKNKASTNQIVLWQKKAHSHKIIGVLNVPIAAFGFLASQREVVSFSRGRLTRTRRSWTSSSLLKEKALSRFFYTVWWSDRPRTYNSPIKREKSKIEQLTASTAADGGLHYFQHRPLILPVLWHNTAPAWR